jgi:hypothetical protein
MGRRWTEEDIANLMTLAQQYPLPILAEKIDRTVGGVVFKAHKLKLSLRHRDRKMEQKEFNPEPGPAGSDLNEADVPS